MAEITGSADADILFGTPGSDAVSGGGSDDRLYGGAGGDVIDGGDGADLIFGESGDDVIDGGGGNDTIRDGAGNDIVHGGEGDDYLFSNLGSDSLHGDAGADYFDFYRNYAGSNVSIHGGAGNDFLFMPLLAMGNTVAADMGEGMDNVYFSALRGSATITLGAGRDILNGFSDFRGLATSGTQIRITDWEGGAEGDLLNVSDFLARRTNWDGSVNPFTAGYLKLVQSGADTVLAFSPTANGVFANVVIFQNVAAAAFSAENFGWSPDGSVAAGRHVAGTDPVDIELLTGGSGDDLIEGGAGRDTARGGSGSDEIHGGEGDDRLLGDAGDDILHGGEGDDLIEDSNGSDSAFGGGGDDEIFFQHWSPTTLTLHASGGDGNDTIRINAAVKNLATVDAGAGDDRVELNGNEVSQTVTLGDGADVLTYTVLNYSALNSPLAGITRITDFQTGNAGDRLQVGSAYTNFGSDPFGSGFLRLVQNGADAILQYDLDGTAPAHGWITLITFADSEASAFTTYNLSGFSPGGPVPPGLVLVGTAGDDRIHGDYGADTIGGGDGNDSVEGLGGDDALSGGLGDDRLDGGGGNDMLEGGEGADSLSLGNGDDIAFGGGGNDSITLQDAGNDTAHGGDGDDIIYMARFSGSSDHIVLNGDAGNDRITVSTTGGSALLQVDVDAGAGDDQVVLDDRTISRVTLGAGRDVLELFVSFPVDGMAVVTDFQAGEGGDTLDFDLWLSAFANTLDANANPFLTGTMRLVQNGADTLVQIDRDGTGTAYGWSTAVVLQNVDMNALRAANLDNYQLLQQHGTEGADTLEGTGLDDSLYGEGGDDTIRGFAGADSLFGGEGQDSIQGGEGADTVQGEGGDDLLEGGAGTDAVAGGDGADRIDGGTERDIVHGDGGDDILAGGDGDDDVFGGDGSDEIAGGAGADFLFGDAGNDRLAGGASADVLFGDLGDDTMDGGEGNDVLQSTDFDSAPQHDVATGGAGSDVLQVDFQGISGGAGVTMTIAADAGGGYAGTVSAGAGYSVSYSTVEIFGIAGTGQADQITTGDGTDFLMGREGDDVLTAGGGADWLMGGDGADVMTGGTGNDRYDVEGAGDVLVENEGEGTDLVESRVASYTLLANFEDLTGLLATGQTLTGNGGVNVIKGGSGNDVIDGGGGADNMQGGLGNDIYHVDAAGDTVTDSGGIDEIRTSLAVHSIAGVSGIEHLTGLADTGQVLTGNTLANTIRGGGGNDQLNGGVGVDTLYGGAGNDSLDGGSNGDSMFGGEGDDSYFVDTSVDTAVENGDEGVDKVTTSLSLYWLPANVENLTGTSASGQTLRGNVFGNEMIGAGGGDTFRMEDDGADKVFGNGGNDVVVFGRAFSSADSAHGGDGTDTLVLQGVYSGLTLGSTTSGFEVLQLLGRGDFRYGAGGAAANGYDLAAADALVAAGTQLVVDGSTLDAGESLAFDGSAELDGRFSLIGGAGADVLTGGAGNDLLDGRGGADRMTGGLGNDIYTVDNAGDAIVEAAGQGVDEIRTSLASFTLAADAGVETLTGLLTTGQSLTGNSGANTINGGAGADVLDGGGGTDVLNGAGGDDTLRVAAAGNVTVNGGSGSNTLILDYSAAGSALAWQTAGGSPSGSTGTFGDAVNFQVSYSGISRFVVTGGSAGDSFVASAGADSLSGGGGDDRLYGAGGNDSIDGGEGKDELYGGLGDDLMTGGAGDDLYEVDSLGDTVVEDEGGGRDTIRTGLSAYTLGNFVEELVGTNAAGMILRGNGLGNTIQGADGADLIRLEDGGADAGSGQGGDDIFFFGASFDKDKVDGGEGLDTVVLQGGYAGTTLSGLGVKGVETFLLLGHGDARFGAAGAAPNHYVLTLAHEFRVDSTSLVIDGSGLSAGETLSFDGGLGFATTNGLGRTIVVLGGRGADTLTGTIHVDELFGGEGNDRLDGGEGSDLLDGGLGDDILIAAAGSDRLRGGEGNDALTLETASGGNGANSVEGGNGNDVAELRLHSAGSTSVEMGSGDDIVRVTALSGSVSIALGAGADTIELGDVLTSYKPGMATVSDFAAGPGGDRLTWAPGYGGGGNLFISEHVRLVQNGADTLVRVWTQVTYGTGYDHVTMLTLQNVDAASLTAYNLGFAPGYSGGIGNDSLNGTSGTDWMEGGAGDDTLDGGAGSDRITGGTGNDLYFVDSAGDVVTEFGGEGTDEVRTGLATYMLGANVENLTATSGINHDFRGNASDNVITAGAGADVLRLQDGGDDSVFAGAGNDSIFFIGSLNGADLVDGGDGGDTLVLQGPYGSLTLTANVTRIENISILAGSNTAFGESGANRYDYALTINDANFAAGVQARINGAALLEGEDFTFDGSAETDASFVVYGGKGKDTLLGGQGNDIFFFAEERFASGDTVNGGSGYDGMFLRGNYTIDFNAPGYAGLFTNIDNLTLTSATDQRYARGGGTEFDYNITLSDAIVGAGGQLTVSGALLMASETMIVDASAETNGTLRLFGGKASDTLKGGALGDLIHGNLGADTLAGGGGADVFQYNNSAESTAGSRDQILDFAAGSDRIDLGRIDADSFTAGNQAFSWIGSSAFTGSAGQLRAYEQSGTWFVEGDINGDGAADLVIALTLQGPTPLSASDFLL